MNYSESLADDLEKLFFSLSISHGRLRMADLHGTSEMENDDGLTNVERNQAEKWNS